MPTLCSTEANNSIRCSNVGSSGLMMADPWNRVQKKITFDDPPSSASPRLVSPSLFRNFDYRPIDFQSRRRRRFRVFESKVSVIRSNFRVETVTTRYHHLFVRCSLAIPSPVRNLSLETPKQAEPLTRRVVSITHVFTSCLDVCM